MSQRDRFAADPMAFFDYAFRARGLQLADFQRERFAALAPALVAIERGQSPPIGRHFWDGTKGSSKDSDIALALLHTCCFAERPIDGQISAADADQAGELRKAVRAWCDAIPVLRQAGVEVFTWKFRSEETRTEFEIVATDATGGTHGSRCDVYVINELSHTSDAKAESWLTQLDNADKRAGQNLVLVASNAGWIDTEPWKLREIARVSPRWFFQHLDKPAPWISSDALAEARQRMSAERYNRLWHGVWSTGEGDALDPGDIEAACVQSGQHPSRLEFCGAYLAALDLGIKHDHSALVVLGLEHGAERIRLAECQSWDPKDYGGRIPLEVVEAAILEAHQRFQLDGLIFDPWQAMLMAERLAKRRIRCIEWAFSAKNLDLMARELLQVFRSRQLMLYRDAKLLADLRKLAVIERPAGYRLDARRDATGHADTAFALAMALPHATAWIQQLRIANWQAWEPEVQLVP